MSTSTIANQWGVAEGCLINGEWVATAQTIPLHDKFSGDTIAQVSAADRNMVSEAVRMAYEAVERGAPPPHDRSMVLRRAAALLEQNRERLAGIMVAEAGFVTSDAHGEIDRAMITLNLSADECTRLVGDVVPFAASPGAHNRIGFTVRHPVGVVCAITPFNSPLNTVLHKVAPAYGAGNAVILKPSAYTPLTSALLAEILLEAGMPAAFISVLQGDGDTVGSWLLEEQDIAFYTFTGSTRVGRIIQAAAGLRRTQMELGSIASTIVCADADLDRAIPKIANATFRKAGQVCTSVQRLYVERGIAEEVSRRLVEAAAAMRAGDPRDPDVKVGPLITEQAAARTEAWLAQARDLGAKVLCGGTRDRSVVQPTVITDLPESANAWCQEAFAPLVVIRPFDSFEDALESANSTPYGLSAGIFSSDIGKCMAAAKTLRFGTVQINETSSALRRYALWRCKDSGFGKEGPWHAMREMTEERLIIINQ